MPFPSRSPHTTRPSSSILSTLPCLPSLPPCLPRFQRAQIRSATCATLSSPLPRYFNTTRLPPLWLDATHPPVQDPPPKPTAYTYLGLVIYSSRIPPTAASSNLFIRTLLLPCLALSCRAILLLLAAIRLHPIQYLQHLSASIVSATSDTTCSLATSLSLFLPLCAPH